MIEGCSLNDSLQIQFLLQLIENSIQSSQTSFSCCLSPSYQFIFSLSSFTAHLQMSSISLLSQLLSFFQYLPSSSTSISRNKIIAFGSNERKQAYLQSLIIWNKARKQSLQQFHPSLLPLKSQIILLLGRGEMILNDSNLRLSKKTTILKY